MRFLIKILFFLLLSSGTTLIYGLTGPNGESYFPIEIINNSDIASDERVYVIIKGINPATEKDCLLSFDEQGWGSCIDVVLDTKSEDYSISLSDLPQKNGVYSIYLPKVSSGRIYFSLGYPMDLQINLDEAAFKIVDPDGFKPRDPNYYTLYDKVEFTYTDEGTWMNPTAVDFFSLPIRIEQSGSVSEVTASGLSLSRDQILGQLHEVVNSYDSTENKIWNKLFLNYTDRYGQTTMLRFMAPGKAMIQGIEGTDPFDRHYLQNNEKYEFNYIDFLWTYYMENTILVDCSELKNFIALDDYIFSGQVKGENFVFHNQTATYSVVLPKPDHSTPWFAGAIAPFNAENDTPKAIIVRELTSAFDVGLLPAEDGVMLNKKYFVEQKENYFNDNILLPKTQQGPWYDLYSKALHSFGEKEPIYAFAYDDALGQDGTLIDYNAKDLSTALIIIGDMSGTAIPNLYDDDTTYTVTVNIGEGSIVTFKGKTIEHREKITDVKMPFQVILNGNEANIYFNPQMVRPNFKEADGIVINDQGDGNIEVTFPGLPK